ncbi:MAG: DUF1549 domain-containing protein [Chthoniobacter sp.]
MTGSSIACSPRRITASAGAATGWTSPATRIPRGYTDADPVRPWAYRYRDYIIRALNADKPMDQFIREQLAGDEMVKPPFKNLSPDAIDKLTATAFLRMVPDGTAAAAATEQTVARNAVVSETLKVVSSLFGLTVAARNATTTSTTPSRRSTTTACAAIFEPGFDLDHWRVPNGRSSRS